MPTVITKTPVTTTFDIVNGSLKLTDYYGSAGIYLGTYSIPDSGVKGVFKVIAPGGTVIYNNTNFSSPDVNGATPRWLKTLSLPTNSDGSLVVGTYSIVYTSRIDDGVHTAYDIVNNASYNFQYTSPVVSITQSANCVSPNFTTVDTTDYTVNTVAPTVTRTLTLDYPFGSAGQGHPLTTSTNTISTGVFYNGTQTTTVSTVLSYSLPATGDFPTFAITDTVTGAKEILVDCSFICSIYCCIRALEQRMINAKYVNQETYQDYANQFNQVMSFVALAKLAIECGKSNEVNTYLNQIKTITECTSDCQCSDTPSLVIGLGGVNVNVVVASGGSPVTVASNTVGDTTTYTVTLEQSFVDTVNASYNTTITSDDSSVNIVQTGSNPVNYDLSVNLPVLNRIELKCTIQWTAPVTNSGACTITIVSVVNQGTKFTTPTIAVNDPSNTNFLNIPNAMKVSAFFSGTPDNNYKILLSKSTEGYGLALEKVISAALIYDVFGRDDTNGIFYFRLMTAQSGSVYAPTNFNMGGTKQELTIVISE